MAIKNNTFSNPFLIDKVYVSKSNFLNLPKKVNILSGKVSGVEGSSANFKIKNTLKASLGEHLERVSLYINPNNIEKNELLAVDLKDFSSSYVKQNLVLLNYYKQLINHQVTDNDYMDSCGVGSHINSKNTIESAFFEFMERQSFVYNWLNMAKGHSITIEDKENKRLLLFLKKYCKDIKIFDISIHPQVKVILIYGYGKKNFFVGLGCHFELEKAINKALEESLQLFCNKYSEQYEYLTLKKEMIKLPKSNSESHFYSNYFFENVDSNNIREFYSYLDDGVHNTYYTSLTKITSSNIFEKIRHIGNELSIDIKSVFIPSYVDNTPIKIIKIITEKGYPHMYIPKIEPSTASYPALSKEEPFPNKDKFIIFP